MIKEHARGNQVAVGNKMGKDKLLLLEGNANVYQGSSVTFLFTGSYEGGC